MILKEIIDEDFINYKKISMLICTPKCSMKCEKALAGVKCCQNRELLNAKNINIDPNNLIERYLKNKLTKAIVFGGLEPFDTFDDMYDFIELFRNKYECDHDIVIYSGFQEEEIEKQINLLKNFNNIIIKFNKFINNGIQVYDDILGVVLASSNQYAKKIS